MNLHFNVVTANEYHNKAQLARVFTESWMEENMYCPRCGNTKLSHYPNNRPVADFFCPKCDSQFELKSKSGALGSKIIDGAYETMISRITCNENPHFFFMSYSRLELSVKSLIVIPSYFFIPEIIEIRKPLSDTARRAGWIGCNILLERIPEQGRIAIVENGIALSSETVVKRMQKTLSLQATDMNARGWLMDTLTCVNSIPSDVFTLADIYEYEAVLADKHPDNKHIKDKIRQQLQLLRDKGYIEFLGKGRYRKVS